MNKNIQQLSNIASKPIRNIIGLMSGTSLDGLDIAYCNIAGSGLQTQIKLLQFETVPFNEHFKNELRQIFSKENIPLQKLCLLNGWVATQHALMINECLHKWGISAAATDLIASHGQTIYHAPISLHGKPEYGNGTLQIGDGDHLAVQTGIITLSDFRQKHIAAGGEGAPLAVYADYLLFKETQKNVILLNIGGIANFTYLPAGHDVRGMFSTDVGPGNTMMDAWIRQIDPKKNYDQDAEMASQGRVNEVLLEALLQHPFFKVPLPKTTGPELFNLHYLQNAITSTGLSNLSAADVMATLNRFSAEGILRAIKNIPTGEECIIYTSGGGAHNPLLMHHLKASLPHAVVKSTSEKNIHPDAKEAILFALLANEAVAGSLEDYPLDVNGFPKVTMGKISFPS
jgi:anhydro-N-acetylmuramic acid kinase